ncbi:MAG: TolC family protein [Planctomycetes bacterium]|nr:TolC family protein [Planctomycetota bacterium]
MTAIKALRWLVPAAALGVASCGAVDPRPDFDRAKREIQIATGESQVYDPDGPVLTGAEIEAAFADGLSLAEATRIAVLNHRRLQAGFQLLGVARADFVQAGLLENPTFNFGILFPDAVGRPRWGVDLLGSLSELWQISARKAAARAELEERVLELALQAADLVAQVREVYFRALAARERSTVLKQQMELARETAAAVARQVELGVATRADGGIAESALVSAQAAYQQEKGEECHFLHRLGVLLSLEQDLGSATLSDSLPAMSKNLPPRDALLAAALAHRPDCRSALESVRASEQRLQYEKSRILSLSMGVSGERPEGGSSADQLIGPALAMRLPIFDQNRAKIRRAEFELERRRKEFEAVRAETTQRVLGAYDHWERSLESHEFVSSRLLPQLEQSVGMARRAFELGEVTVLSRLEAERRSLDAKLKWSEVRLASALAVVELDWALGFPANQLPDSTHLQSQLPR